MDVSLLGTLSHPMWLTLRAVLYYAGSCIYSSKPNLLAWGMMNSLYAELFKSNSTASAHVFSMNLKILGFGFSCLSQLLSFKVAQKKKGEGQVNLMKRGGKLKQEWPKFSNVKVSAGTSGSLSIACVRGC